MSKIASTYAQALFDAASDDNTLEDIKKDLGVISSLMKEQPQLMEVLTLPKLSKEDKKELIKKIYLIYSKDFIKAKVILKKIVLELD